MLNHDSLINWHWEKKPDLDTIRYRGVFTERPNNVSELGVVKEHHDEGTETNTVVNIRLVSKESTAPLNVEFINLCGDKVRLLWMDFLGNEVAYNILQPRCFNCLQTFLTHPWIVRRVEDNSRMLIDGSEVFLPREGQTHVLITSPPSLSWTEATHRFFPASFKERVRCFLLCLHRLGQLGDEGCPMDDVSTRSNSIIMHIQNIAGLKWSRPRKRDDDSVKTASDTRSTLSPPLPFHNLPVYLVPRIVLYLAMDESVAQTFLKGLDAAPDLPLPDLTSIYTEAHHRI